LVWGLVWFGLVWFGLVWFGLVWFGLVWFGLVWFGWWWSLRLNKIKAQFPVGLDCIFHLRGTPYSR